MKNLTLLSLAMVMLLGIHPIEGKVTHLLPTPKKVEVNTSASAFALGREVRVVDETNTSALTRFLTETNCTTTNSATAPVIEVEMVTSIEGAYDYPLHGYDNEAYTIAVEADKIHITAIDPIGVIRAAQTLTQLAEGYGDATPAIEAVNITDWPAFKLRGLMHDVGRSFLSVEEIKKELNLLARFKVNTFHFHLTENQAWRFEVKEYPQLTQDTYMTRFAGSYYTQKECTEIEQYAAERGIIVIPEIDMPGHSGAFERAMGYNMQSTQGMAALKKVLEEVAVVFPLAPYIHIGADEVTITNSSFLPMMTEKLHSLNKKVVCWNPIANSAPISTSLGFDMTQMWSSGGKKIAGMPNIDCRYNYVNHFDVYADLVGIYKSNIYYAQQGSSEVAGTITAVWNDRKTPTQEDIIKQNNVYANTLASAERAWIGGGKQYIEDGGTTLPNSGTEFNEFADWERRFLFHKANSLKNEPIPYVKQTNICWRITDAFPNNGNVNTVFPPEESEEMQESYEYNGKTYNTGLATGGGIYLRHTWGGTIPTYYSNPQPNHTAYAWTWVYSEEAQTVGAQIEFQNYGRSEKDRSPINGSWDHKGSKVWVNGNVINPPTWENSGKAIDNEKDLLNENFSARNVTPITLQKGWNKILLKLPYIELNKDVVRLNKWMFTFVLTDPQGKNAVEGLVYSPSKTLNVLTEQVTGTIEEINTFVESVVGTEPGYYPASTAEDLLAIVAEIEETLGEDMSDTERNEQLQQLQIAFDLFKDTYQEGGVNKPKASNGDEVYYYTMKTPNRGNRYLTSRGTGSTLIGNTSASNASYWRFEERSDGTYNIINYSDNTYLNPAYTNNSAMRPSSTAPSQGWKLELSAQMGLFIVISGTSAELNQTTSDNSWQIFNWGWSNGVANKTDDGCLYELRKVDNISTPDPEPDPDPVPDPNAPVYTAVDLELNGSTPIRVPDIYAQPLFAADEVSVVVDFTVSSLPHHMAFAAASDTTATSSFLSNLLNSDTNGAGFGIRWGDGGESLTARDDNTSIIGARRQVVMAMTKTSLRPYLNSTLLRDNINENNTPWTMTYSEVNNANALYIGGFKTIDNKNKYPFTGTIHSIRFYAKALSNSEVMALSYDNLTPSSIENVAVEEMQVRVIDRVVECNLPFTLYSIDGRVIPQGVRLPGGIYVVKTDVDTCKVVVH